MNPHSPDNNGAGSSSSISASGSRLPSKTESQNNKKLTKIETPSSNSNLPSSSTTSTSRNRNRRRPKKSQQQAQASNQKVEKGNDEKKSKGRDKKVSNTTSTNKKNTRSNSSQNDEKSKKKNQHRHKSHRQNSAKKEKEDGKTTTKDKSLDASAREYTPGPSTASDSMQISNVGIPLHETAPSDMNENEHIYQDDKYNPDRDEDENDIEGSDDNDEGDQQKHQESFERAVADLEILCAAYPEEIAIFQPEKGTSESEQRSGDSHGDADDDDDENSICLPTWFPLVFTLALPMPETLQSQNLTTAHASKRFGANITMELPRGYPTTSTLQIVSYRITSSPYLKKEYIEKAAQAVTMTAAEALEHGEECGFACCASAIECWNEFMEQAEASLVMTQESNDQGRDQNGGPIHDDDDADIHWITAENTLVDRRSVFQAHLCRVSSDDMAHRAVRKLILSSTKIQRATHNMWAYRFIDKLEDGKELLKHDNDDDGESGSGSRLAQLIEMRKEDGVLVLVSRWYGGTHLGPKRFAHITNVARDLLVEYHEKVAL